MNGLPAAESHADVSFTYGSLLGALSTLMATQAVLQHAMHILTEQRRRQLA